MCMSDEGHPCSCVSPAPCSAAGFCREYALGSCASAELGWAAEAGAPQVACEPVLEGVGAPQMPCSWDEDPQLIDPCGMAKAGKPGGGVMAVETGCWAEAAAGDALLSRLRKALPDS